MKNDLKDPVIQVEYKNPEKPKLSKSEIFGLLQNDRRRNTIELLKTYGSQSPRFISEEIARLESGIEEPSSNIRKSIYVSLHQTHLPKMENMGILIYDRKTDEIKLTSAINDFDIYLETVKKGDISWGQYYMGLSIFFLVGSMGIVAGIITWISTAQWMIFINIVFVVSAAAHVRQMNSVNEKKVPDS